jgi:hypothetical protein
MSSIMVIEGHDLYERRACGLIWMSRMGISGRWPGSQCLVSGAVARTS